MALCGSQVCLAVLAASCSGQNGLKAERAFLKLLGYSHETSMAESDPDINQKEVAIGEPEYHWINRATRVNSAEQVGPGTR